MPRTRPLRKNRRPNDSQTSSRTTRTLLATVVMPPQRRSALLTPLRRRSPSPRVRMAVTPPGLSKLIPVFVFLAVNFSKLAKTSEGLAIWPPLPAAASAPQVPNEVSSASLLISYTCLLTISHSSLAATALNTLWPVLPRRPPPDALPAISAPDANLSVSIPHPRTSPAPLGLSPLLLVLLSQLQWHITSLTPPSGRNSLLTRRLPLGRYPDSGGASSGFNSRQASSLVQTHLSGGRRTTRFSRSA